MAENILITIAARSGSRGLPGKNVKEICGKPLIAWTIEQAWRWGKGEIILSSDSDQIIALAEDLSVKICIKRPLELAKDDTPKIDVLRHILKGLNDSVVVDLDVTNPLRRTQDIENAYQTFIKGKYDSLSSVVRARKNPYFSMLERDSDKRVEYCKYTWKANHISCRQQAPEVYEQNANIYIYSRDYLLDETNRDDVGLNAGISIMPDWTFCDINTPLDFEIVEFLMERNLLRK